MIVLAGPNGAGKSTYYERYLRPTWGSLKFINADAIAREQWPGEEEARSYDAAQEAETRRRQAMEARESFITETVFSHESKLQLLHDARALGYQVRVFYIGLDSALLSAHRVTHRVGRGGHSVPQDKLAPRYARTLGFLPAILRAASVGIVLDNSHQDPYLEILEVHEGRIIAAADTVPSWLVPCIQELLRGSGLP